MITNAHSYVVLLINKQKKGSKMAVKSTIIKKLAAAVLFGIGGYILGYLLTWIGIFPPLAWDKLGLFAGVLYGLFQDEIEELF